MNTPALEFQKVIETAGLRPSEIIADGQLHRCGTTGKERGQDGAYIFHPDPPASGWFINWRTSTSDTWASGNGSMSPEERKRLQERIERDKAARLEAEEKRRAEARDKAKRIYEAAKPCPADHPYLKAKGIRPIEGVRVTDDGKLVVPVLDPAGGMMSLQFIDQSGGKKFLTGGQTLGGLFAIEGEPGPLFVAEGLATAMSIHEATGRTVLVAFNAGNLLHVARTARIRYPEREIIIAGDDDHKTEGNPGRTKAEEAAKAINATAILPRFMDRESGTDFNDLAQAEGIETVRAQLMEAPTIRRPFRFIGMSELLSEPRSVCWIVRDYLEGESLSVLFGPPGTMKSFVALDLGLCVASGRAWHGHPVDQGPVLFLAGEGFSGLSRRIKAWMVQHDIEDVPLFVSDRPAQFLETGSCAEVAAAIEGIAKDHGNPRLLVIDTLNRNFGPGDENATGDMTRFVAALDELRTRFKCAVLVLHHSGLAEKNRGRGSSALRAALDFEYKLDVQGDVRTLTCTKIKDHEPPALMSFKPLTIEVGWTDPETGAEICSCVLERTDTPPAKKGRLTGSTRVAFEALVQCINAKADEGGKLDKSKIHLETWRAQAHKNGVSASDKESARRMAFQRAVSRLLDLGMVQVSYDYYWIKG